MKILVTGGAGFIGTNLIIRLLKEKHEVISLDNYSTGLKSNEVKGCKYIRNINIGCRHNNPEYIQMLCESENIELVFHLAAIARIQPSFTNPEGYLETNYKGTYDIVRACTTLNIPLIYAGSSSHHSGKYKNPYTFSKTMGEEIIQLYQTHFNLKSSIARFYNVYGPFQLTEGGYTTLIGRWVNNINKNTSCEIYGDGKQRRDFTHVDDIVEGLILMMKKESYGHEFELGRGKNISINEVAKMFNINPIYKDSKPGEARHTLCKSKLAKQLLNWNPQMDLIDYIKDLKWKK
tara:strand:+ start:20560 stop:21432 length:873 start_codon:yes stop_codon:yes gene_type:complete